MQTVPASSSRIGLPFLALCCLGLILFVIAAAIVLALIPVYLPRKSITPAVNPYASNGPIYLQYSAPGSGATAISGNVQNTAAIASALKLPSNVKITAGQTSPSGVNRRKRSFFGSRAKRDITINILFTLTFTETICNTPCLLLRKQFETTIQQQTTINNCPLSIDGGPLGSVTTTVSLTFVGLLTAKPSIFVGPPSSATFTSTTSGDFTNPSIWDQQQIPNGPCTVVIGAGTTVTLSLSGLSIGATSILVYGTLIIGGGNNAFRFVNPLGIQVFSGGNVIDATISKLLIVAPGSVIYALSGGSFGAAGTVVQAYSSTGSGSTSTISNPNGPLTCAVFSSGSLNLVKKIIFFAVNSGSITSALTFLGGLVLTAIDCQAAPCGLTILPGVTLSTSTLNGVLSIDINEIDIDPGATMQLGTPGSTAGFKFMYAVAIESMGTLSYVASGGNILLPIGSIFAILAGGSFISSFPASLQIYNPLTGALGAVQFLGTSITTVFGLSATSLTGFLNITSSLASLGVGISLSGITIPGVTFPGVIISGNTVPASTVPGTSVPATSTTTVITPTASVPIG